MADLERSRLDRCDHSVQRIWRLAPTERHSLHWLCSIYKGPVLVRAPSEAQARSTVARAFGLYRPTRPQEAANVPWLQEELSTCDELEDSPSRCAGPTRILEPLDLESSRSLVRPASRPSSGGGGQQDKDPSSRN